MLGGLRGGGLALAGKFGLDRGGLLGGLVGGGQLGLVLGGLRGGDFPLAGELGLPLGGLGRSGFALAGQFGLALGGLRGGCLALAGQFCLALRGVGSGLALAGQLGFCLGELGAGCLALLCQLGPGIGKLRGALALVGELGLHCGDPSAELLDLGGSGLRGRAGLGQLGLELLTLGAWAGGGLAGRRELVLGRVQFGPRLDQLGLRAHELAAQLHQLGAHVLGLGGVDGALDGRALDRTQIFLRSGAIGLVGLPEHGRGRRSFGLLGAVPIVGRLVGDRELVEQGFERRARCHCRLNLELGHHGDVVYAERVRRIGHRHQEAAADEAHGHCLVALRRRRLDHPDGARVHLVALQIDVGDPVALRGRARELLLTDSPGLHQDLRDRASAARLAHGFLHRVRRGKAQLDDHVAQEARAAARLRGWDDSLGGRKCGHAGLGAHATSPVAGIGASRASFSTRSSAASGDSASPSEHIA